MRSSTYQRSGQDRAPGNPPEGRVSNLDPRDDEGSSAGLQDEGDARVQGQESIEECQLLA